ncbi:MAG TPA: hypothetical protein VE871_02670 [Longimicrobium sp.]|nr:hypothetical protein [Longimicrobium sp.]
MSDLTEGLRGTPEERGLPRAYWAATTRAAPSLDEVRARVPGWGGDLDYADRPAVPMEDFDPGATNAHWDFPEQQPEKWPREMSPEHGILPPVFGTGQPPRGISGVIRRYAYTLSEARASHWLLLLAADRVDVLESSVESALKGRPDNPLAESGVFAEFTRHGIRSRAGKNRADVKHQWMDPLIVAVPWVIGGFAAFAAGRALSRALGASDEGEFRRAVRARRESARRSQSDLDADYARSGDDDWAAPAY